MAGESCSAAPGREHAAACAAKDPMRDRNPCGDNLTPLPLPPASSALAATAAVLVLPAGLAETTGSLCGFESLEQILQVMHIGICCRLDMPASPTWQCQQPCASIAQAIASPAVRQPSWRLQPLHSALLYIRRHAFHPRSWPKCKSCCTAGMLGGQCRHCRCRPRRLPLLQQPTLTFRRAAVHLG